MPYKKEYHTIVCKRCGIPFQVLTPSYKRRLQDSIYGEICISCRAKILQETITPEERKQRSAKAIESAKKHRETLTDEEKSEKKELRKKKIQNTWKQKSKQELSDISEKRSRIQKDRIQRMSAEQREEIRQKMIATKRQKESEMTAKEKADRRKHLQEKRKRYWDGLSEDERAVILERLRQNAINRWAALSEEEYANRVAELHIARDQWYANLSDAEKMQIALNNSQRLKDYWNHLSDEEKSLIQAKSHSQLKSYWESLDSETYQQICAKRKDAYQKRLNSMSADEIKAYHQRISDGIKEYWNTLDLDTKRNRQENASLIWYKLDPSAQKEIREFNIQRWKSYTDDKKNEIGKKISGSLISHNSELSPEERQLFQTRAKVAWDELPDSKKQYIIQSLQQWRKSLSDEEWEHEIKKQHAWLHQLTPEQRAELNHRIFQATGKKNKLHQRFEEAFKNSHLSKNYHIIAEVSTSENGLTHSWDYGIYDKDNELVMLVDLDGAYFHADICDYDGVHSHEEYDERRSLSAPSGVKIGIIQELNFAKGFQWVVEHCIIDYDSYIQKIFDKMRSIQFPFPQYTQRELLKSYVGLLSVDEDSSLHTRAGDRLIQHFHQSIYHAHRKGRLSPYDAWMDDVALKKCIENRVIYQNQLNPNKILQGFNVSKIAPKVSVFSAGRARILIQRYLKNATCIFDPFSGFSGRMLGTVSLGKQYIGQDYSSIHIAESNEMISFLKDYGMNANASMVCRDVFQSYGEYEALFTCPPYGDLEQWLDVPVSNLSCDDWVSLCLQRFQCKQYLFVVDQTNRYSNYVIEEIKNQSNLGINTEHILYFPNGKDGIR